MDKSALRQKLKQQLMQMSREEIIAKSKIICDYVIGSEVFQKASVVMAFLSLPHEVDTTPLILAAWQRGKTVAVPKISWQQRHMIPVEIASLETGLKTDEHGLRNPIGGIPVPFDEIDLVITPGLGFDAEGNRLGRGGSYYDNFFTSNKITAARWALAFSHQICPAIPHDDSDVPVDAVVTENGIILCKRN
ncbi:MAG TPA: 5-formyltetrahydrofolate cyclo-ligase [Anaerohalosphaeraceae bacterium]|nr:5-formyltetrahydrofolate cyclo-ligase [Phycisphaerae bacterium]HOK96310.1 5-formyltetrahydrofolate cyclo-ligase [Anaerohalosphaeraceae bacterium]HOL31946.1 5-formyltetrahydrofolate cyclo-ligase [Anaerohalosphaeraceae bacterium]HOM76119.1 5-formyltetrahydrofolate cyclo-ligase [Anaerohalosphaeraceae bacterium]HPC63739.1 5-formyltetrahydrofolate cyclo-ligase [Anaerohalosphaeraceae bacterium]